jgi:hypothetical protein
MRAQCPKHDIAYKRIELAQGKTLDVCESCVREARHKLVEMFPFSPFYTGDTLPQPFTYREHA